MIEDAEASGKLKPGYTIVEPSSGNTGKFKVAKGVFFQKHPNMDVENRWRTRSSLNHWHHSTYFSIDFSTAMCIIIYQNIFQGER